MDRHTNNVCADRNLNELIIGIDGEQTNTTYPIEKLDAHLNNVQHVAISIFIFCGELMLLQKRANSKYHSGGLWANTVCSHPRWNESVDSCATRRLREELGFVVPLRKFGELSYAARVGDLYENEHVHCFFGHLDSPEAPEHFNREEVSATMWLSLSEIETQMTNEPESFSAWFKIYMHEYLSMINSAVGMNAPI